MEMDGGAGGLHADRLPVVLRQVGAVSSRGGRVSRRLSGGGSVLPAALQSVLRASWLSADQRLPAGQLGRAAGRAANAAQPELLRIGGSGQDLAAVVAFVPRPQVALAMC